jgi:hypothetical protein
MLGKRRIVVIVGLLVCLVAGSAVYAVFFKGEPPASPEEVAALKADADAVLANLDRTFGTGDRTSREARDQADFSYLSGLNEPRACDDAKRLVLTRNLAYRHGSDQDLVGRTFFVLRQRGYAVGEVRIIHSGEGTIGPADKNGGRLHFQVAAESTFGRRPAHYQLAGYVLCH